MKIPRWIFGVYWGAYLLLQGWYFSRARIDYFDAFDYLRNARRLAGAPVGYQAYKPPLTALMHAPLQLALDWSHAGAAARLIVPHLYQCLIAALLLLAAYRYFALYLGPQWAGAGVILFSLNRMILHYFGSVMSDVPSAFGLLLFLYLLAKPPRRGGLLWAWLALAACALARWNLLLLPPLCAAAAAIAKTRLDRAGKKEILAGAAVAFLVFLLVFTGLLAGVFHIGPKLAFNLMVWVLGSQAVTQMTSDPAWLYGYFLWNTAGLPAIILLAVGIFSTLREEGRLFRFPLAILAGFFAVMSLGVGHKEARYLISILPLVYFFAAVGLKTVVERLRVSVPELAVAAALVIGAAAFPVWAELPNYLDQAKRSTVILDAADAVNTVASANSRVFWNGTSCTMIMGGKSALRRDPFYDRYDVPSLGSTEYLLGRRIFIVDLDSRGPLPGAARFSPGQIGDAPLALTADVAEGDVVVVAPQQFIDPSSAKDAELNRLDIRVEKDGKLETVGRIAL